MKILRKYSLGKDSPRTDHWTSKPVGAFSLYGEQDEVLRHLKLDEDLRHE